MEIKEVTLSATRRIQPDEFAPLEYSATATFVPDNTKPLGAQMSEAYTHLKTGVDRQLRSFQAHTTDLAGLDDGRYIVLRKGKKTIAEIKTNTKGRKVHFSEYIKGDIMSNNASDITTKYI